MIATCQFLNLCRTLCNLTSVVFLNDSDIIILMTELHWAKIQLGLSTGVTISLTDDAPAAGQKTALYNI